jgi:hypothetical protein
LVDAEAGIFIYSLFKKKEQKGDGIPVVQGIK